LTRCPEQIRQPGQIDGGRGVKVVAIGVQILRRGLIKKALAKPQAQPRNMEFQYIYRNRAAAATPWFSKKRSIETVW
jgi:hypothetical protein